MEGFLLQISVHISIGCGRCCAWLLRSPTCAFRHGRFTPAHADLSVPQILGGKLDLGKADANYSSPDFISL